MERILADQSLTKPPVLYEFVPVSELRDLAGQAGCVFGANPGQGLDMM